MNQKQTIWLDVADLCEYARAGNTRVSGIQRVVVNLITGHSKSCLPVVPVWPDYYNKTPLQADPHLVFKLAKMLETGYHDSQLINELVDEIYATRTLIEFSAGDVFVFPGCFWIYSNYELIAEARSDGVRIAVLIYDLIQITCPEFVSPNATKIFVRKFVDLISISDVIMAISQYVAHDVRSFTRSRLGQESEVLAMRLATEIQAQPQGKPQTIQSSSVEHEYVLFVSTIEIRKNHKLLIRLWERLLDERQGAIPKLVFVGKWGWMVDDLRAELAIKPGINDWLIIINSASDAQLAELYKGALFTIYPSLAEGWGLPVGESLAYGIPCIASNRMSIPEVGGDLVRYFDPLDLEDALKAVTTALDDRVSLGSWKKRIAVEFKAKTWADFASEFYAVLAAEAYRNPILGYRQEIKVSAGCVLWFGDEAVDRLFVEGRQLLTLRMARVSGWGPVGRHSVQTREPKAVLRFGTDLPAGTRVMVFLNVRCPVEVGADYLAVDIGGVEHRVVVEQVAHLVQVEGVIGKDSSLQIIVRGGLAVGSGAMLPSNWLELFFVGFEQLDELARRLPFLEHLTAEASRVSSYLGASQRRDVDLEELAEDAALLRRFLVQQGKPRRYRNAVSRLASAWLLWTARRNRDRRSFAAAERSYRNLISINPNRARLWVEYGDVVQARGDSAAAIGAYRNAVRIDRDDLEARRKYANVLDMSGRTGEAHFVRQGPDRIREGVSV